MKNTLMRIIGLFAAGGALFLAACGGQEETDYRVEETDRQPGVQSGTTGTDTAGTTGTTGATGMTNTTGSAGGTAGATTTAGNTTGTPAAGGGQFGQDSGVAQSQEQDSRQIEERIRQTLAQDDQLALTQDQIEQIDIQVEEERVVLSGTVPSQQDAQLVEQRVSEIRGVEFVQNNLQASR